MIEISEKTTSVNLTYKNPDRKFWSAAAVEIAKEVRKRTVAGYDVHGKDFKAYSKTYAEFRASTKRSTRPDLVYSNKMLSSMKPEADKNGLKVSLSGKQAEKAEKNERLGREFFAMSDTQAEKILDEVGDWILDNL